MLFKRLVIYLLSGRNDRDKWIMNTENLDNFINDVQRDSRLNEILFPFLTIEQIKNIIKTFEFESSNRKKCM